MGSMVQANSKEGGLFGEVVGGQTSDGGSPMSISEAMGVYVRQLKLWLKIQEDSELAPLVGNPKELDALEEKLGGEIVGEREEKIINRIREALGLNVEGDNGRAVDGDSLEELVGKILPEDNEKSSDLWGKIAKIERGELLEEGEEREVDVFLKKITTELNEKLGIADVDNRGIVKLVERVEQLVVRAKIGEVARRADFNEGKTAVAAIKIDKMTMTKEGAKEKLFLARKGSDERRGETKKLIEDFESVARRAETKELLANQDEQALQEGFSTANKMEDRVFEMVDRSVSHGDISRMKAATKIVQETYLEEMARRWAKKLRIDPENEDDLSDIVRAMKMQLKKKNKHWFSSRVEDVDWDNLRQGTRAEFLKRKAKRKKINPEREESEEAKQRVNEASEKMAEEMNSRMYEGEVGELGRRLDDLIAKDHLGEAVSLMMEYVTRVGSKELRSDIAFMGLYRRFREALTRKSPDLAEQIGLMEQIAWSPNIAMLEFDKFTEIANSLFGNKANIVLLRGEYSMVLGNRVIGDGVAGEFVVNPSLFADALLEPENLFALMRADPNTTDGTLRKIMLKQLFGTTTIEEALDIYEEYRKSNKKLAVSYAKIGSEGFEGWEQREKVMGIDEWLDNSMWMMRSGMTMMWFEGEWMANKDLMAYQRSLLQSGSKSLLTGVTAKAAYMSHFNNVSPCMYRGFHYLQGMLGPMSVYKEGDIRINAAVEKLVGEGVDREIAKKIAGVMADMAVRRVVVEREGKKVRLFNRLRDGEKMRLMFNDLAVDSDKVKEIVYQELARMGVDGIPEREELYDLYLEYLEIKNKPYKPGDVRGHEHNDERRSMAMVFGSRYEAVWQEIVELKMMDERDWWESLDKETLLAMLRVNYRYTRGKVPAGLEEKSEVELRGLFAQTYRAGAFMNRAKTTHGDDYREYFGKYLPAFKKTMELFAENVGNGLMLKKHIAEIDAQLARYLSQKQREEFWTITLHDLYRMHDYQLIGENIIPLTKSRKHKLDHPWWKFWQKDEHAEESSAAFEIIYPSYQDKSGKTWYGVDVDGVRITEVEDYRGNYALEALGVDYLRPGDIEDMTNYLQMLGVVDEHSKHKMVERVLGKRKEVRAILGKLGKRIGMSDEAVDKMVETVGGRVSSVWSWMITHLPFFDDPKYALFSLLHEVTGMGWKTVEYIFGFDFVGGGKSGGGHH